MTDREALLHALVVEGEYRWFMRPTRDALVREGTKTRRGRAWLTLGYTAGWVRGEEAMAVDRALACADAEPPEGQPWCVWHAWSQVLDRVDRCPCAGCRRKTGGDR